MASQPPPYDPTVTWVRHCARCGAIDDRERWATKEEAGAEHVTDAGWRCPACGNGESVVKLAAKLGGG